MWDFKPEFEVGKILASNPVIYIYKLHYSVSSLFLLKFNISL